MKKIINGKNHMRYCGESTLLKHKKASSEVNKISSNGIFLNKKAKKNNIKMNIME